MNGTAGRVPVLGQSPLVGRDAEIQVLDAALDVLGAGRAHVVQVAGEPGIGKTRLLSELRRRAAARGYVVFSGRVAELERSMPFAPFVAALDDHLVAIGDSDREAIGDEELHELAEVFPALRRFGRERPTLQAERYRSYRAVRSLLEGLSRQRALVVTLDDLQWADDASGELLGYLLRSLPRTPVLLALAFRSAQLATPLATALERAGREGTVSGLEPAPLTPSDADALLGPDVPAAVRAELHRLSGGNPFYLEQLARAPAKWQEIAGGAEGLPSVPAAVRAALAAEIHGVAPTARRLLEAGAVVGDPFDLDLAADVADLPDAEALGALDALTEAELLHPTEAPRRFRFRHPILRRAVYESTGAGWRLAAHARAATRLGSIAAQALHVERSAAVGDDEAITVLTDAGLAAKDPRTAARWFGSALRLLPDNAPVPRRLELMEARADALRSVGELGECHEALLEILAFDPPGPARRRIAAACACVEHLLGRLPEARDRLEEALEDVADALSAEAVNLRIEVCGNALLRSEPTRALSLASSALETAATLPNHLLMASAAAMRLQAQYVANGSRVEEADLAEAIRLVESLDAADFARRPESAVWLGGVLYHLEHFDDALRHLQRAIDASRATGQGHLLVACRLLGARAATSLGRLGDADRMVDASVAAARLSGNPRMQCRALAIESHIAHATGDHARALSSGQESYDLLPSVEPGELVALARLAYANALLAGGQVERARAVLVGAGEGGDFGGIWPAARCAFYEALTACELALGNPTGAADWASRATTTADALPLALPAAAACRARAEILLADGDAAGSAAVALAAADRADRVQAPIDAARSRLLAGRALGSAGTRAEAVDHLQRAHRDLAACGAEGFRTEVSRELRRLGRRVPPQPAAAGTPTELSPREVEIIRLLADNRRNREIAAELYISEKTVETHVSHIFAKLAVSSRRAAVMRFTELTRPS